MAIICVPTVASCQYKNLNERERQAVAENKCKAMQTFYPVFTFHKTHVAYNIAFNDINCYDCYARRFLFGLLKATK